MIFTSFNFLIIFPLAALLYWLTPARYRWLTLLLESYFFYININPIYAVLLAGITTTTYITTRLIAYVKNEKRKKMLMITNIIMVLLPLLFFKYFTQINNTLILLMQDHNLNWPLPSIQLFLPIGISFYTFMAIGYTVDVYNEEIEVEKNPGMVALFVSFFPLILSGPIERAKNMIPQFNMPCKLSNEAVIKGLKMMIWGYFMKLVVADRIGFYIDPIFSDIEQHNGITLLLASVLYPIQIYVDLGGYSLIAIGTAKILGLKVMDNFNRTFFATSMSEFWRRWHISLISWLKDYIYTPFSYALRKYKMNGIVIALIITFLISGIWHGAAFTFVIWGLMQGLFLSIEAATRKKRTDYINRFNIVGKPLYKITFFMFTFILFTLSMVFVRADNTKQAIDIFRTILYEFDGFHLSHHASTTFFLITFFMIMVVLISDALHEFRIQERFFGEFNVLKMDLIIYSLTIISILLFGVFGSGSFIYFQF